MSPSAPASIVETRLSREGFRHTRYVYIVVQKRVTPETNPEIDSLMALVESFIDFLVEDTGLEVATESGMPFILDEPPSTIDPSKAPVDPQILADLRTFTVALKLKMVSRTPGAAGI